MRKKFEQQKNRQQGFTLIELLVVIVILGLLVGLVGPKVLDRLKGANQTTAQTQIQLLSTTIDTFRLDMGRYPKELGELVNKVDDKKWEGPYLPKRIPKDPWGNSYEYKFPGEEGREYDIISYGADGTSGGDEENIDIVSWKSFTDEDEEADEG
jgi:general secretion pathway protein G